MKQRAFGIIHLIIVIAVIVAIGGIGFFAYNKKSTAGTVADWTGSCSGNGTVPMTHAPMDIKDINTIFPVGTLAGEHVTPIDHLYFYPKDMHNRDAAPVYAMADGYIVHYENNPGRIRLVIQHTCSFFSYFDLLTSLDPAIEKELTGFHLRTAPHVAVKSGQVLGKVGAQSLDTGIYNFNKTLTGFIVPEHFAVEFWKIHTDDFFSYFSGQMKDDLLALDARKAEPRSGKLDYDIDGKLVGTWFQTGTGGYSGKDNNMKFTDDKGTIAPYYVGHFSIAPDAFKPETTDVSFGSYQGKATQFSAGVASPDPATVDVTTGLVKYELHQYVQPAIFADLAAQAGQGPGLGDLLEQQRVRGTVLLQMTGARTMKMEAFPDKKAADVTGFTSAAVSYNR